MYWGFDRLVVLVLGRLYVLDIMSIDIDIDVKATFGSKLFAGLLVQCNARPVARRKSSIECRRWQKHTAVLLLLLLLQLLLILLPLLLLLLPI